MSFKHQLSQNQILSLPRNDAPSTTVCYFKRGVFIKSNRVDATQFFFYSTYKTYETELNPE